VTVDNPQNTDYTLAGPGALAGEVGLFKKGAGTLTLAAANTSSGGLALDSGAGTVNATLSATQDSLGTGPVSVGSGSTLVLDNANTASATVTKANAFSGTGSLTLTFAANATARSTALSGLSGFAGTMQVGSAGPATGDKLDASGTVAPDATLQIADGHTLLVGSDGAPASFGSISIRGAGNAENRGALRMAANASTLAGPLTLLGNTTLASDSAGALLTGSITGTAGAGATNILTQGTPASAAGCTLSGAISDGANGGKLALTQTKGVLTLSGANTYSGATTINGNGTLQISAVGALPSTGVVVLGGTNGAGNLALGAFNQTLPSLTAVSTGAAMNNLVTIASGQELAINGSNGLLVGLDTNSTTKVKMAGGGALVVNHASANVTIGKGQPSESTSNTSTLDLSELSSVTLGSGAAPINEIRIAYGQLCTATLTLSNTSNLLTATALQVGNSLQLNAGSGGTLILGAGANSLSANTVIIGLYKGIGTVKFASQAAGSPGAVTIGGRTRDTTDFTIGSKGGMATAANPTGTLDLRGHVATVAAGAVTLGKEDNSSYWNGGTVNTNFFSSTIGSLFFDAGAFTATNLTMAAKTGGSKGSAIATLTVSGGVFTVSSGAAFMLASQAGWGSATGTLNVVGGTFRSFADIRTGTSNCVSTVNLDGGTLDMTGRAIGLGSQTGIVLNARSGTLMNLGSYNNGAPLIKTGNGTLTFAGTNTYSGATIVSNGTLRLTGPLCLPPTADLYLSAGTTTQLDYDGRLPIRTLFVDGVRKMGSLYGQDKLSPYLSGTGFLELASPGTLILLK
jgi:autotransporter-associated beta strand protein